MSEQVRKRRIYRTESQWRELIDRQERSGVSQQEFCKSEGISPANFHKWKCKLREQPTASFMPVSINQSQSVRMELELPGGIILRVNP